MAAKSLFDDAPVLTWDAETMTAKGAGGLSARVWRSRVSDKLVLSIDGAGHWVACARVTDLAEARQRAEQIIREDVRK